MGKWRPGWRAVAGVGLGLLIALALFFGSDRNRAADTYNAYGNFARCNMPSAATSSESEIGALLQKLLAATRAGRIAWTETTEEDSFQAAFTVGVVEVRKENSPTGSRYGATVLTPSSSVVADYKPEHDAGQTLLQELYSSAWRSALQPGRVLEEIAREIDAQMKKASSP